MKQTNLNTLLALIVMIVGCNGKMHEVTFVLKVKSPLFDGKRLVYSNVSVKQRKSMIPGGVVGYSTYSRKGPFHSYHLYIFHGNDGIFKSASRALRTLATIDCGLQWKDPLRLQKFPRVPARACEMKAKRREMLARTRLCAEVPAAPKLGEWHTCRARPPRPRLCPRWRKLAEIYQNQDAVGSRTILSNP